MNRHAGEPVALPGSVSLRMPKLLSETQLYQEAEALKPVLKGRETEVEAARSRLELAKKNQYPDFQLGLAYGERTGLAELKRANLESALPADRRAEFSELLAAEALITLHVLANATAFLLAPQASEVTVETGDVEEVLTDNGQLALHGALWELDQAIARHGSDEARMVATVLGFAEALMDKVATRAANAPRLAPFTAAAWRVEADDFAIRGFEPARRGKGATLAMTFKEPHEVVGNHIAKYQSMRLAKMLMAYDFDRKLNPFADLGGFIFTFMGDGAPGTGKTTLIQMMAGLVNEYCLNAGYPFRYQNFSIDQIDSYQGKSGQNAKSFITNILDPSVIGFGTIDDIDQIAGKRVFLGPPGGAAFTTMARLFKAVAGLEEGTDYEAVTLGWDAAAAAFQDGNIDVYCNPTNAPSPALTQIAVTNEIRFLGIPADKLETEGVQALVGRPGFSAATLPAGIYGDNQLNEGDVTTLGVTVGIVTNQDADEEMIYEMTKAFYAGVAEAGDTSPWLRAITPEGAVQDINLTLHPGALRALTELGVDIPEAARG